jgi:16S rRNA (uracil1498-N3)-methyltransferase
MSRPRLLVRDLPRTGAVLTLRDEPLRHLRALRLGAGDRLLLFDGCGREHEAEVTGLGRRDATVVLLASTSSDRESPLELVLAPAVLRGVRMDRVFEQGTQLGVTRFAPTLTARAQSRRVPLERWRRVVEAAGMQSGRARLPIVDPPRPFPEVVAGAPDAVVVVAFEGERRRRFAELPARAGYALVMSGPEGGFTADEVVTAERAGAHLVGLGARLLRAETAALVLAALAQQRWGDG